MKRGLLTLATRTPYSPLLKSRLQYANRTLPSACLPLG